MHFFSASLIESKPTEALVVELVRGYTIEHVLEDIYKNDAKRLGIAQLLILRAPVATPINPSVLSDFLSGALTNTPPELDFFGEGPHVRGGGVEYGRRGTGIETGGARAAHSDEANLRKLRHILPKGIARGFSAAID